MLAFPKSVFRAFITVWCCLTSDMLSNVAEITMASKWTSSSWGFSTMICASGRASWIVVFIFSLSIFF